jgi:hypothetical protein
MIPGRPLLAIGTVDQRAGAGAAGRTQHQGYSVVLAAAWIETLHNRAERSAARHLRSA